MTTPQDAETYIQIEVIILVLINFACHLRIRFATLFEKHLYYLFTFETRTKTVYIIPRYFVSTKNWPSNFPPTKATNRAVLYSRPWWRHIHEFTKVKNTLVTTTDFTKCDT